MSSLPTRTDISGTPSKATLQTALSSIYDFVAQRFALGTTGAGSASPAELAAARSSIGVGEAGSRNRIVNGGCEISQRYGSSVIALPNNTQTYSVDRMQAYCYGAATTFQRTTFAGAEGDAQSYALLINHAASLTATYMIQRMTASDTQDMPGKSVVASCWVWQNSGNTLSAGVAVARANAVDNFAGTTGDSTFTVSVNGVLGISVPTNTWCKISATATLSTTAPTGLQLSVFMGGTMTTGYSMFTKMQFELGTVATAFEHLPYWLQRELCRYTCRVLLAGLVIATGTNRTGGTSQYLHVPTAIGMRTNPAISYAGALPSVYAGDSSGLCTSFLTDNNGSGSSTSAAAGAAGDGVMIYTGSATTFSCDL
jgi:hypothetical protein